MLHLPPVFVLSVKSFHERIRHIEAEFSREGLNFEFIFEFDKEEITPKILRQRFHKDWQLSPAHASLVVKHIIAWEKARERGYDRVLIFEDDVILIRHFKRYLKSILDFSTTLSPCYLISLGGADAKIPFSLLRQGGRFLPYRIETTEAYLTDRSAIEKRLNLLTEYRVASPADFLIRDIDSRLEIPHYWAIPALVEQGSLKGFFSTTLDHHRLNTRSWVIAINYRMKIFRRRIIPNFLSRVMNNFQNLWSKYR